MKRINTILVVLALVFCAQLSFGQEESNPYFKRHRRQLDNAEYFYINSQFDKALKIYKHLEDSVKGRLIEEDVLIYRIGHCYYNSWLDKEKAIPYLESYIALSDSLSDGRFYLASVYHFLHRFDEAIANYEVFRKRVEKDEDLEEGLKETILRSIEHDIIRCHYGKLLVEIPVDAVVENLGPIVNTEHSEYAPVINPDESELVITRRSPENTGGKLSPDGNYFEDIYVAKITEGRLLGTDAEGQQKMAGYYSLLKRFGAEPPLHIGENVNTPSHEGGIQFSADGKRLFIYHDFNVWVSNHEDGEWQKAKLLEDFHEVVNTKSYEPSVSISNDEHLMFISSDRPGGYGGLDLYVATKQMDGSWGEAINLGPSVNTEYDEDGPYIDPDGRTLYFSSKGHSSMGGYDIFKTQFNGLSWSAPQNMGYPINSAGDDIFYMMTPLFNRAYYSSNKFGGYGQMDIYRITFADEREPLAEVKGLIKKGEEFVPAKASVTVIDERYDTDLYTVASDSASGHYNLMFDHGHRYSIRVKTQGFAPYRKRFEVPKQVYYYQYYQEIHHVHLKDKEGNVLGQTIEMHNLFSEDDAFEGFEDDGLFKDGATGLNMMKSADVKFFISQDSLMALMAADSTLKFTVPEGAEISFYNGEGAFDPDSEVDASFETISDLPPGFQYEGEVDNYLKSTAMLRELIANAENSVIRINQIIENSDSKEVKRLVEDVNTYDNKVWSIKNMLGGKRALQPDTFAIAKVKLEEANIVLQNLLKRIAELDKDQLNSIELLAEHDKSDIEDYLKYLDDHLGKLETVYQEAEITEVVDVEPTYEEKLEESMFTAQKTMAKAQYSISGVYQALDTSMVRSDQARAALDETKRLLSHTQSSIAQTQKLLGEDKSTSIAARASMEETQRLIHLTQTAIIKTEKMIILDRQLTASEKDSLNKIRVLLIETQASLIQSEIALSQTPETPQSFEESLATTEDYVFDITKVLEKVAMEDSSVQVENVHQKVLETQLAILRTKELAKQTGQGMSPEAKKSINQAQKMLDEIQNSLIETSDISETAVAKDTTYIAQLKEVQQVIEKEKKDPKQESILGLPPLVELPKQIETQGILEDIEEKGVTQEHIVKVVSSLVQTQKALDHMLDLIPETKQDQTKRLELLAESQRLLSESMEENTEINLSIEKTHEQLTETQMFISSTRYILDKYPDTNMTLRQYYAEYDNLLERTNKSLEITQRLLKGLPAQENQDTEAVLDEPDPFKVIIYFAFDKHDLRPESVQKLKELIDYMKKYPQLKCKVIGHTDAKGSDSYNLQLSKRRASEALQFVLNKGVSRDKFVTSGEGEAQPIAPNSMPDGSDNPDGRQLNRRVEFELYQ